MSQPSLRTCQGCERNSTMVQQGWILPYINRPGIYHQCDSHARRTLQATSQNLSEIVSYLERHYPETTTNLLARIPAVQAATANENEMTAGKSRLVFARSIVGGNEDQWGLINEMFVCFEENQTAQAQWASRVRTPMYTSASA